MLEYFFCLISGSLLLYSRMALVTLGEKKGNKEVVLQIKFWIDCITKQCMHLAEHYLSKAVSETTNR
jgi:hypothetical protein